MDDPAARRYGISSERTGPYIRAAPDGVFLVRQTAWIMLPELISRIAGTVWRGPEYTGEPACSRSSGVPRNEGAFDVDWTT